LALGADPNVIFDDGGSVMYWAVHHVNNEFLKEALKHGGNPNLTEGSFIELQTPNHTAVSRQKSLLHEAAMGPGMEKAEILLSAGADINARDAFGNTPVMDAVYSGQFDIVLELLNRGADYTIPNKNGFTLEKIIADRRKTVDPKNELTRYLDKVIDWLAAKGVTIPDKVVPIIQQQPQ
jgi:ankyrin repeat protein